MMASSRMAKALKGCPETTSAGLPGTILLWALECQSAAQSSHATKSQAGRKSVLNHNTAPHSSINLRCSMRRVPPKGVLKFESAMRRRKRMWAFWVQSGGLTEAFAL